MRTGDSVVKVIVCVKQVPDMTEAKMDREAKTIKTNVHCDKLSTILVRKMPCNASITWFVDCEHKEIGVASNK